MAQRETVSNGTRSRKGCLTCRIRKKKCDEELPACSACRSRDLACYGFNVPPPPWITNKASWKDVLESNEARALRTAAELRYRVSRKLESRDTASGPIGLLPPDSGSELHQEFTGPELQRQHRELEQQLDYVCHSLREDIGGLASVSSGLDFDIAMITLIWAYGARVFLQVVIAAIMSEQSSIDQTFVNTCLEKFEALPTRLVIRTAWPYTITGCMAMSKSQHHRFRQILNQVLQEAQAPGITWKGLIVMEECWRLRRTQPDQFFGWREAMESLGARVILT
ncbi:hypothetical protein FOBRF1_013432 [Fusarium oxysporum]